MTDDIIRRVHFDPATENHERSTQVAIRPVTACTYPVESGEKAEWDSHSAISQRVACLRAQLTRQIVSGKLTSHVCVDTFEQIQIQGEIIDADELTFFFNDSWFHHQYECPQDIGKYSPLTSPLKDTTPATLPRHVPAAAGSEESHDQTPPMPNGRWLMDTGCGHDLINDRMAQGLNVRTLTKEGRLVFATANGRIESRNVVPVMCKEFNQVIQPYLLRETPPVLSIGKRCMEQGCTFHWEAGRNPIMTNPEGLVVEFEVDRNIPYFVPGSADCQTRLPRETKVLPIATMEEARQPLGNEAPCLGVETEEENEEEDRVRIAESDRAWKANLGPLPGPGEAGYDEDYEGDGNMYRPRGTSEGTDEEADDAMEEEEEEEEQDGEPPDEQVNEPEDPAEVEEGNEEVPQLRRSAAQRLKKEAESYEHQLSHLPKNPYCIACIMGKMKEKYSRRKTFKRELTEWGETITCDHVYSGSETALGFEGETETFIIKDLWSGLIHCYPVPTKAAAYVIHCIQQFVGKRRVQTLYSDNAAEFMGSCRELMMARDGGQPGVPHTNGIIERCNQLIIGGTTTCLIAAGLPPCYWSFASPCFCFNLNTLSLHGPSPWEMTHGVPFAAKTFPFGCLVMFKPNEVRTHAQKWSPKAKWGVFAGYKIVAGYSWRGEYLVWDLVEFQKADLRTTSNQYKQRATSLPHSSKVLHLPAGEITFPLKKVYDRVNTAVFDPSVVDCSAGAITMMHPSEGPGRGLSEMPTEDPILEQDDGDGAETPIADVDDVPEANEQVKDQDIPKPIEVENPERVTERAQHEMDMEFNRANLEPVRNGRANDGIIYGNLKGNKVRLDIRGREFPCDLDGVRTSMKSTRPEGMDPAMWNILRPWRAAEAKKAAKAAKLAPQPRVAPMEADAAKKDAPDAGGSSSSKPPSPGAPACTSLALGEVPLAVSGAIFAWHRGTGEISLVKLLAHFDPRIVIDDGALEICTLVKAMVLPEASCPAILAEASDHEADIGDAATDTMSVGSDPRGYEGPYDPEENDRLFEAGLISNYELQRRIGCVVPTDQESSGDDAPSQFPRWYHQAEVPSGSGDPRSSPQSTYIYDDSLLLNPLCRPSSSPCEYGPGTRILIQFGFDHPWQTRILCERVVSTISVMHASDGDISCVDLDLKKNTKLSCLKICNKGTWIVPDGMKRLESCVKMHEPIASHWKAILSYARKIAKGERFLQCITRGQKYLCRTCLEGFAFDASVYCSDCMHMFCESCHALDHNCPRTYERCVDDTEGRYLPERYGGSFSSDSKSHASSSSNEEPVVMLNPRAPGYDAFAHQMYVAQQMETEGRQSVMHDIRAQTHPAVAGIVVGTTGEPLAKAKAKAKAQARSAEPKAKAVAKTKAAAKARAQRGRICVTCHTTWIIDNLDQYFHVTRERWERFGCTVCFPVSEGESSDYEHNWEGFSLSDADHDDSRGMPVLDAQQWDEWEDTVEEFRRNLPQSMSAVASAT